MWGGGGALHAPDGRRLPVGAPAGADPRRPPTRGHGAARGSAPGPPERPDALRPLGGHGAGGRRARRRVVPAPPGGGPGRSEEHTSELQSLMRISYHVFRLQKNNN